jgi:hypothetical protein
VFVRFYVVYDGIYKGLFYGKVDSDGIEVTTGIYSTRDVKVKCSNWMKEAENQTVDLLSYQTSQTADSAIRSIINNLPRAPLAVSLQTGTRTFDTVFDVTSEKTKAISEINKLTMSEFGLTYLRGGMAIGSIPSAETLVFENRTNRYNNRANPTNILTHSTATAYYLLKEDGDRKLWEDGGKHILESSQAAIFSESDIRNMRVRYGKHIYNRVKLTSYPRKIDASPVVLWNLENEITLEAGQTLSGLRSSYRDPNGKSNSVSGINMITPVATTDYTASSVSGSGSDKTAKLTVTASFGTSEVEYSLTNADTATIYVTFLQFRGYGVYIYDQASVTFESPISIRDYGTHEIEIDMPYVNDATTLFTASNNLDRALLETGDRRLWEDGGYKLWDDAAGVFDFLVSDEPQYWIERATFTANRSQFNMLAFMCLDAGSSITISETMTGISGDTVYYISGYDMELKNGIVEWSPLLIDANNYPKA